MAYEVTATRRRPQTFDDLVGQEFAAATLKNAIISGKIAHAYLFSGPRGCGKTSSARILAKALNCEKGPTPDFCGKCSACTEITRGSSMDVIEIDGASNTSVNDIRQIKDEILFPPNSCRYKVYIIDEVHMLSTSAFNALLKTIEEPPPYVVFIFATTELHKVPATIKSRCQQFHFRLGSVEQIKELLAKAANEINIQADNEALYWIARESTGSFRDAYTLFDQIASFSAGHITYEKIRDTLGLVGIDSLNSLCEICVSGDTGKAVLKLDEILQSGVSIEQLITNLTDYLRSLLFIKSGITQESLLGQSPSRFSNNVISTWNQTQLERSISLFLQLFRDIRYSLSPRYELELAISRLCKLSSYIDLSDIKQAVENAKSLLTSSPQPNGNLQAPPQNPSLSAKFPPSTQGQNIPFHFSDSQKLPSASQNSSNLNAINTMPEQNTLRAATINQPSQDIKPAIPISINDLREKTIAELSFEQELLSSALVQTSNWIENNNTVTAYANSAFIMNQLNRSEGIISKLISTLSGRQLSFKTAMQQTNENSQNTETPKQVTILTQLCRGTITNCETINTQNNNSSNIDNSTNAAANLSTNFDSSTSSSEYNQNYTEETDEY